MKGDDTAPATKADIAALKEEIGCLREFVEKQAEETRRYFDVVAERMHHDFLGIFKDRTQQHSDKLHKFEERLTTVERRLGIVI